MITQLADSRALLGSVSSDLVASFGVRTSAGLTVLCYGRGTASATSWAPGSRPSRSSVILKVHMYDSWEASCAGHCAIVYELPPREAGAMKGVKLGPRVVGVGADQPGTLSCTSAGLRPVSSGLVSLYHALSPCNISAEQYSRPGRWRPY